MSEREFSSIQVTRASRLRILEQLDRLRWYLGEPDGHAPHEIMCGKLPEVIGFAIDKAVQADPAKRKRMEQYKPSLWLQEKQAQATKGDEAEHRIREMEAQLRHAFPNGKMTTREL